MVVLSRSEVSRARFVYFLTIALAGAALIAAVALYSGSSEPVQLALALLALIALPAIVLSFFQLYSSPGRSQVMLMHLGDEMLIATNLLHEGFKLRFLRDILNDNVVAMSDADRAKWKFLEDDGFYPTLCIRNPKKLLILRLCTMIFDDVFAVDRTNRWEHYDTAGTADPTASKSEMPRLKAWKGI